jgi:uncharacterized protein (DUF433 family)
MASGANPLCKRSADDNDGFPCLRIVIVEIAPFQQRRAYGLEVVRSDDLIIHFWQHSISPALLSQGANAKIQLGVVVVAYPISPYVEQRNDGLYVAGTGVSLDSVVIRFQQGASPEKIVQSFPTLKLSQTYGVIAYYLENEKTINDYIAEGERELEQSAIPLSRTNPELFARLEAARRQIGSKRS